jgi:hypothetical protein
MEDLSGMAGSHLAKSGHLSGTEMIPDLDGGAGQCRGVVIPIGVNAESGVVAAACDRIDFPTEIDRLLLCFAANHAATVFQTRALKNIIPRFGFLESIDKIDHAIEGTSDLDQMIGDVLDVVLAVWDKDA